MLYYTLHFVSEDNLKVELIIQKQTPIVKTVCTVRMSRKKLYVVIVSELKVMTENKKLQFSWNRCAGLNFLHLSCWIICLF